jgi:class 3 adenylate cyclase/tetratricopeptide (TPR) repeat protein
MIKCRHCQALNPEGGRFCEFCGGALEAVCAACRAVNRQAARFCGQCGASMDAGRVPSPGSAVPGEGSLAGEGERKQVTVLFADIRGSTQLIEALDPEAAMGQLDPTLQAMATAVTRFGGVVNSVRGDGIMALFGVPVACEDHAVRACLAACDMIDAAQRLNDPNISIRVGMDSGEVVIRPIGSDASDYEATGVIAHLANRVEQQATPGSAFLTGRTARLARGHVDVASLGRVPIKGLSEPLELFQLLAATARPTWEARCSVHALNSFVGRDAELHQLSAALERAALGCGQVVTLVADAGFGKSRLAHEFLREARSSSWNVLRVAAMAHTTGGPYHLAAELLRALLAVDAGDDRAEVARKLTHTLALIDPEGRADLAPLQSLLDLPVHEEAWPRLAPPVRRSRSIAALRTVVLREAALHPLILLVEDYHWADLPSTEVLDAVVEGMGAARLLLLVTTRPDRYPPWTRRSYCQQLQLPALEPESAGVLLRELIGPSSDLASLRQQILVQAGGVPLFIEEIARSLNESGVVAGQDRSHGPAERRDEVVIPASVQAIIAARIDRLPPLRRRLLHVASVIGKDVPLNLLEAVAGLPHDQLERGIAELQAGEFLYELDIPSGREYTFRHVLIQTVAYEEMLRKTRRELHARVMSAMQTLLADRLGELTERLAEHAMRGEVWAAAVTYSLQAGDRATGRWAWREAIGFYDRAIEALTHLPVNEDTVKTSIEARLRLRVALPGVADLPRIARCLDEARSLALTVGDPAQLAEIDTSKCLTLTKMGLLEQAVEAGRQGYERSRELGEKAAFVNASFALAQACWYQGEFRQSEDLLLDRLDDLRGPLRLKNTGTTGTASVLALVCLSKTYAITGQHEKAAASIAEARAIAQELAKPFDLSYSGVGSGFCLLLSGDAQGAVAELEESLRLARSADIALLIPSSQRYLGRAYALTGRLQEAEAVLDDAIARTTTAGLLGMRLWSRAALAQVQLRNAPGAAGETLATTLELARRYGFRPLQALLMRLLGKLYATHGGQNAQAAQAWCRQAIQLADELGMAPEAAQARRDLAAALSHIDLRTPIE